MDILDENNAAEINKSYKHDTFLAYTKIKSLIEDAYTLLRETKNNGRGAYIQQRLAHALYSVLIQGNANIPIESVRKVILNQYERKTQHLIEDTKSVLTGGLSHALVMGYFLNKRREDQYLVLHHENMKDTLHFLDATKQIDFIVMDKDLITKGNTLTVPVYLIDVKTDGKNPALGCSVTTTEVPRKDRKDKVLWEKILPHLEQVVQREVETNIDFSQKIVEVVNKHKIPHDQIHVQFVPYRSTIRTRIRIEEREMRSDRKNKKQILYDQLKTSFEESTRYLPHTWS